MMKVYYQHNDDNNGAAQDTQSEGSGDGRKRQAPSESRDKDDRRDGNEVPSKKYDNKGSFAVNENELRERLRKEMEEEIRGKVIEEERAKIREEMEREKKIQMIVIQQKQYEMEKEQKERERIALENQKAEMMIKMSKEVDDELDRVLDQIGSKIHESSEMGLSAILEMIYSSTAYKKITSGESVKSMTLEQKQQLVIDLKAILKCASITKSTPALASHITYSTVPSVSQYQPGIVNPTPSGGSSSSKSYYSSYSESPASSMQQGGPSGKPYEKKPEPSRQPSSSSSTTSKDNVSRINIGELKLRSLSVAETRKLIPGSKVVAQDRKTGKWQLASVVKIASGRALLQVGSATWKKDLSELYWEDDAPF